MHMDLDNSDNQQTSLSKWWALNITRQQITNSDDKNNSGIMLANSKTIIREQ